MQIEKDCGGCDMHNKHTQQQRCSFQNMSFINYFQHMVCSTVQKKAFELLSSRRVIGIRFMDTLLEGSHKI